MQEEEIIIQAIEKGELSKAIFSSPFKKADKTKLEIRPLLIKNKLFYQVTEYKNSQAFHQNKTSKEVKELIFNKLLSEFKQALFSLKDLDYHLLTNKKGVKTYLKKNHSNKKLSLLHNRKKNYLLDLQEAAYLLEALGIVSKNGALIAKKNDKYRQLNRFLEMVQDILPHLKEKEKVHIVDFGCGKAYLTFALYYYLHTLNGYNVDIHGLDLKKEVVSFCEGLARQLNFEGLHFSVGDIKDYEAAKKVDMVVTLHACDTATDAALAKAVHWGADVILSVPCCQHELFSQIQNKMLQPLLKHGILRERFSALVTDAARAELLESMGYRTQILEFIDMEHTPKNLLIRAVKGKILNNEKKLEAYELFKKELNIRPALENLLKNI